VIVDPAEHELDPASAAFPGPTSADKDDAGHVEYAEGSPPRVTPGGRISGSLRSLASPWRSSDGKSNRGR